ncbi:MAG: hypothetical protein ACLFR1_13250 [Spirochaetia bacterium]
MSKPKVLDTSIVFHFSHSDPSSFYSRLDKIVELLSNLPESSSGSFNWRFHASPYLEEESSKVTEIRHKLITRIKNFGDQLIPTGYTGTPQYLLLPKEGDDEHQWAWLNPWDSGFAQLFPIDRQSTQLYERNTEKHPTAERKNVDIYPVSQDIFHAPYIHIIEEEKQFLYCSENSGEDILKIFKRVRRKREYPCICVIDCDTPDWLNTIEKLLETITRINKRKQKIRLIPISQFTGNNTISLPFHPRISLDPLTRSSWQYTGILRGRTENSEEEIRKRLHFLRPANKTTPVLAGKKLPELDDRLLISNMQGDVLLTDRNINAAFSGGRFKGFQETMGSIDWNEVSWTGIHTEKESYTFSTVSGFSFESLKARGLRECLTASAPLFTRTGKMNIDYTFVEDYPAMLICVSLEYPVFGAASKVLGYAPLEIPLLSIEPNEAVEVLVRYPNRQTYTASLGLESGIYRLPGSTFYFSANNYTIMLASPENEEKMIDILPVRVEKRKSKTILFANPHGSYCPVDHTTISGTKEYFTLVLSVNERGFYFSPVLPDEVENEVYKNTILIKDTV